MANLIDKKYFNYEISVPDSQFSDLDNYITRFEKEVLTSLLGYELYKEVIASTATEGPIFDLVNGKEYTVEFNGRDQLIKWNGLKNTDKVSLIAYYVYFNYQKQKATIPVATGRGKPTHENSTPVTMSITIHEAWSRMRELYGYEGQSDLTPSARNFLLANIDDYPEWVFTDCGKVNSFDL